MKTVEPKRWAFVISAGEGTLIDHGVLVGGQALAARQVFAESRGYTMMYEPSND